MEALLPMIDILAIRDRLNELPFQRGQRRTLLGRISEMVPHVPSSGTDSPDEEAMLRGHEAVVAAYLAQLDRELAAHDLQLGRGGDDPDELYAIQQLRHQGEVDLSWMGLAWGWASRIIAGALVMVAPGIAGMWLDQRAGTRYLALLGLAIGVPLGLWYLLRKVRTTR
jgi:hypothetical protein